MWYAVSRSELLSFNVHVLIINNIINLFEFIISVQPLHEGRDQGWSELYCRSLGSLCNNLLWRQERFNLRPPCAGTWLDSAGNNEYIGINIITANTWRPISLLSLSSESINGQSIFADQNIQLVRWASLREKKATLACTVGRHRLLSSCFVRVVRQRSIQHNQ